MPDREEMAPGEIARTLIRLEKAVANVDHKIDNLDVVKRPEYEADRRGDDLRLSAVEQDIRDLTAAVATKADGQKVVAVETDIKRNRQVALTGLIYPTLLLVIGAVLAGVLS